MNIIIDGVEYVPKAEEAKEANKSYFFLGTRNELNIICSENGSVDQERKRVGNMFPTEQKAEYERLRRECMATGWVPKREEKYYRYDFNGKEVWGDTHTDNSYDAEFILGLARPTKEEAQARWDKYGDAWLDALEPKK